MSECDCTSSLTCVRHVNEAMEGAVNKALSAERKRREEAEGQLRSRAEAARLRGRAAADAQAQLQRMREALEVCVTSLVDAGRDHSPAVAQARLALAPHPTPRTQEGEARAGLCLYCGKNPCTGHGTVALSAAPAAAQGVEALRERVRSLEGHVRNTAGLLNRAAADLWGRNHGSLDQFARHLDGIADNLRALLAQRRAPPEGDAAPEGET